MRFYVAAIWLAAISLFAQPMEAQLVAQEARILVDERSSCYAVVFSPDGKWLATNLQAEAKRLIRVWDTATWKEAFRLAEFPLPPGPIFFSPDSKTFVVHTPAARPTGRNIDDQLRLFEVPDWQERRKPISIRSGDVAYCLEGRCFLSKPAGQWAYLHDAENGRQIDRIGNLDAPPYLAISAISPDGRVVASGSNLDGITLWDLEQRAVLRRLRGIDVKLDLSAKPPMLFSPDGKMLVSRHENLSLTIWDAKTGEKNSFRARELSDFAHVAFTPDSKRLIIIHQKIQVFDDIDAERLTPRRVFTIPHAVAPNEAMVAALSPDGRHLAVGTRTSLKIVDLSKVLVLGADAPDELKRREPEPQEK